jgi:hypothetical protein
MMTDSDWTTNFHDHLAHDTHEAQQRRGSIRDSTQGVCSPNPLGDRVWIVPWGGWMGGWWVDGNVRPSSHKMIGSRNTDGPGQR